MNMPLQRTHDVCKHISFDRYLFFIPSTLLNADTVYVTSIISNGFVKYVYMLIVIRLK